jgi:predicted acetyltransferase
VSSRWAEAPVELRTPSLDLLPGFADACRRGWSRDNIGLEKTAAADLERIAADHAAFVASMDDPQGAGEPITLPDGSVVQRLPGYHRWLWDGEFAGTINFRWQPGTAELPPHVLGHIGYVVCPWKRGRGYASRALALLLPHARALGMAYVELTTTPDNIPSQKVITNNGGVLVERFEKAAAYGGGETLRWRIYL